MTDVSENRGSILVDSPRAILDDNRRKAYMLFTCSLILSFQFHCLTPQQEETWMTKKVASEATLSVVYAEKEKTQIIAKIHEVFGEDGDMAVSVAIAESDLNPTAVNGQDSHRGCTGSIGLFQVGCLHMSENPEALKDIDTNIRVAYTIFKESGWKPWGVCTNGSVNCGL